MRALFKLRIKYAANQQVANILDKLCCSAVDDGIKPELQLAVCLKLLLILQDFKNFDSNMDMLIDFKNRLARDSDPQAPFSSDKSIIDAAAALNTMIMHYQRRDTIMPLIDKGIDIAIAFLKRRQQHLEEILAIINQPNDDHINKMNQTQTTSNRKRKLAVFADVQPPTYIDESTTRKNKKTTINEAETTTTAETGNNKSHSYIQR